MLHLADKDDDPTRRDVKYHLVCRLSRIPGAERGGFRRRRWLELAQPPWAGGYVMKKRFGFFLFYKLDAGFRKKVSSFLG